MRKKTNYLETQVFGDHLSKNQGFHIPNIVQTGVLRDTQGTLRTMLEKTTEKNDSTAAAATNDDGEIESYYPVATQPDFEITTCCF
eukprot:scaffold25921_cov137-Cylindrotheca_fusiformis.AAC.3